MQKMMIVIGQPVAGTGKAAEPRQGDRFQATITFWVNGQVRSVFSLQKNVGPHKSI